VGEDDDCTTSEGGIRFAAWWKDQERWVMLTVLETLRGEGKGGLSTGSAPWLCCEPREKPFTNPG